MTEDNDGRVKDATIEQQVHSSTRMNELVRLNNIQNLEHSVDPTLLHILVTHLNLPLDKSNLKY